MSISSQTRKLLVIDDDLAHLLLVKQSLTKSFSQDTLVVYEAGSSKEGLQKIDELSPDIILSSVHLPDINEVDVWQQIRKYHPQSAIILMASQDAEEAKAAHVAKSGAEVCLTKPVSPKDLFFAVNLVLRAVRLNNVISEKNQQLDQMMEQIRVYQQRVADMSEELRSGKRLLDTNLAELRKLNSHLEEKNAQIDSIMQRVTGHFDSTVTLLANLIELSQPEHIGHSERVAEMSMFVAEKMGLSESQIHNINVAARLHELGIVSQPIGQRTRLSLEAKKSLSSKHPLVGEMLLKSFTDFEPVAEIIRHLHENIDGSGTPDGLSGEQIPIGSRIIAAVSYFDHLHKTDSEDPYETLEIMESKGKSIFDERVMVYIKSFLDLKKITGEDMCHECSAFSLMEGMELAADIYTKSGVNLLRKGTIFDKTTLTRVLKFNNVDPIVGSIKIRQR